MTLEKNLLHSKAWPGIKPGFLRVYISSYGPIPYWFQEPRSYDVSYSCPLIGSLAGGSGGHITQLRLTLCESFAMTNNFSHKFN